MKCCYCGAEWGNALKPAPGLPAGAVSHGICARCVPIADAELDREIEKAKKEKTKNGILNHDIP